MICPLCLAEYREGVSRCAQCNAVLATSIDAQDARGNPPRLIWQGRNLEEFDSVIAWLQDAQVPANAQRAFGGLIGAVVRASSSIHVLTADVDFALRAIQSNSNEGQPETTQNCYNCSSACSAFLAICPTCKAQLIVEPAPNETIAAPPTSQRKYCPVCDAEYSVTHETCSVCGVSLVAEEFRGMPLTDSEKNDRLELVWRGGDPAALSNLVALLREAGIRHHVQSTSDHLVFEIAMPRPKYNVRVLQSDAERARQLLAEVSETPFFGAEVSPDFSPGGEPVLLSPAQRWNPAAANSEVWAGEDAAFARLLEACLRENRIGFRRQGVEPGAQRLLVMSEDVPRAQEILREIVEANPSEWTHSPPPRG